MRKRNLIDAPRDARGLPVEEPLPPDEAARRWAELGRVLLNMARARGYVPPEKEVEQ